MKSRISFNTECKRSQDPGLAGLTSKNHTAFKDKNSLKFFFINHTKQNMRIKLNTTEILDCMA